MKKIFLIATMSLMFAVAALAAEQKEFVITYVKYPLNIPSIIEKELGLFEKEFTKEGYSFKYPEITSGPDQTQAIAAGSVDVANCVGGISVIIAAANGLDIKGASVYSRAPETFMIITKDQNIKSIKDLKGKKIAGSKGTLLHQLLAAALEKNGMKLSDVEHINMGNAEALAAMEAGSVQVALLAGPAASKALANGAKIVTTGKGYISGTILIAVPGKLERENPDFVKRIVKVHRQALDFIKNNPEKAYEIAAKETGMTIEQVKEAALMYDFDPEVQESDIKDLQNTVDFLLENKMIRKGISVKDMMVQ